MENLLIQSAAIIGLGVGAQWIAWRLKVPSILLLLVVGFVAGPVTGMLDPDALMGKLLMPIVSISVALILFEGGLTLRLEEIKVTGSTLWVLVTLGAGVTWMLAALSGHYIAGLSWPVAVLLGSILVVTGPTVIGPLLRHIRPSGKVASVLKWEGIVIDPIGAVLAVLVFEVLLHGSDHNPAASIVLSGVVKTLLVGGLIGGAASWLLVVMLKRHWVPDFLQNAVSLALVVVAFAISNFLQEESGLLTATVMGFLLANQKAAVIRHVIEFKENLRVLLLSSLFVLLAARLDQSALREIDLGAVLFVVSLILVVRPLSVFVSTLGSSLNWKERLFLSWMAPRGIVAASIASVFAAAMVEAQYEDAAQMVPITFLVIAITVTVYGLTAGTLARWLGIATPNPQGLVIAGAHPLACQIAEALKEYKIPCVLIDSNYRNITAARQQGLRAHFGDLLATRTIDDLNLAEMGRLLAMTPNDQVNCLTALHFAEVFGRESVFQLSMGKGGVSESFPSHLRGRILFGKGITFEKLYGMLERGGDIRATRISDEFKVADFKEEHGARAVPLFTLTEAGRLNVISDIDSLKADTGTRIISLIEPKPDDPTEGAGEEEGTLPG